MYCHWIVLALLLLALVYPVRVDITNIKCTSLDESCIVYEKCLVKSVNRTYKYVTLNAALLKQPVTDVTLNFQLFKWANVYKPFLYNVTIDACKFILNPKSNPIMEHFYNVIKPYTNMNHSCPYNHHVNITELPLSAVREHYAHFIPFSEGQYMAKQTWIMNKIPRGVVKIYMDVNY